MQFIVDKFKNFVSQFNIHDENSTKFVWEHLKMDSASSSNWEDVIPEFGKSTPSQTERAKSVVKSFLNRGKSKEEIGNHFELEIFNSQHSKNFGFYRCLRITTKNESNCTEKKVERKIEQLYFVDIFSSIFVTIKEVDEKYFQKFPGLPKFNDKNDLIEAKWMISKWGECNRCGKNVLGEQRRKIECVIEPKNGTNAIQLANSDVAFLTMFENVPCLSSLLPLKYRQKFQSIKNIEEFRSCQSLCLIPNNETRIVKEIDESGKEFVADELPPNEFSILERLPPLQSTVIRKTVRGNEGDNLVLDCGHNNGDIFWRRDFKDLYSKDLLSEDSTTFRRYINSDGQLIFQTLEPSDAGFYSCFTTPNILQRTFRVYINKINKTVEIIMYIKIIIRYFTGFLIAILILRTILKTNAIAEFRHRAGIKKG
uniref:Ig-like domain-containing protein n=1 Tax=Panagrolaimus sp. PS1159 TaxID=55785 RepID=A0AC35GS90_9BILA